MAHSCRDGEKGRGEARRRPRAASAGRKGDRLEEGTEGRDEGAIKAVEG